MKEQNKDLEFFKKAKLDLVSYIDNLSSESLRLRKKEDEEAPEKIYFYDLVCKLISFWDNGDSVAEVVEREMEIDISAQSDNLCSGCWWIKIEEIEKGSLHYGEGNTIRLHLDREGKISLISNSIFCKTFLDKCLPFIFNMHSKGTIIARVEERKAEVRERNPIVNEAGF